jgi:hypothetical protein
MATDTVFVYTMNRGLQGGAWSRYVFPWTCEHFAHLYNTLYIRHGDDVSYVIQGATDDDGTGFEGTIQWPWLDFGNPGVSKMQEGFDIVGTGTARIAIGYDQSNIASFTAEYNIPEDSMTGQLIPFPLLYPSASVKLIYDADQDWTWNAFNLYLNDQRPIA